MIQIIVIIIIILFTESSIIGGSNLKLIGHGVNSNVYLTALDEKKVALRRIKVYPNDEFDKTQPCWTELNFYKFIGDLNPEYKKHFLTLYKYEFVKLKSISDFPINCVYKGKDPKKITHFNTLSKSNVVLDQYINYIPNSLIVNNSPNNILFKDYDNFIKIGII